MSNELAAQIAENFNALQARIAAACARAGRVPSEITLIGVSKTVEPERIAAAIKAGIRVLGENRVQETLGKMPALADAVAAQQVTWHLIGQLQSNKARKAVETFDYIQTVDSLKLAERLNQAASECGKRLPVLIEVNLGNETSKAGVTPHEVLPLSEKVARFPALDLRGLMAVPPFLDEAEQVRPYFRQLRELRDAARAAGIVPASFNELSMGMSGDFEAAIVEGATFIRVGTALFGARAYDQSESKII